MLIKEKPKEREEVELNPVKKFSDISSRVWDKEDLNKRVINLEDNQTKDKNVNTKEPPVRKLDIERYIREEEIRIVDLKGKETNKSENLNFTSDAQDEINHKSSTEIKSDLQKEAKPNRFLYYGFFLLEILFTMVLSLIPVWSDQFEMSNPMIVQEREEQLENDESNEREENLADRVSSQRHEVEELKDEKEVIKSSTNTRKVHNDEQSKKFNIIQDENKTENEFIFSENVYIDNLSYNESMPNERKKVEDELIKEREYKVNDTATSEDRDLSKRSEVKYKKA